MCTGRVAVTDDSLKKRNAALQLHYLREGPPARLYRTVPKRTLQSICDGATGQSSDGNITAQTSYSTDWLSAWQLQMRAETLWQIPRVDLSGLRQADGAVPAHMQAGKQGEATAANHGFRQL